MECNRDEATRAKEIAEQKFSRKDITGAKKFALKAQNLYPDLEGISQLLAILNVYVAVENKMNGELDFYGILGVNPLADDETIRKNYRRLALSLHPDKNKSVGADGAFKYVSEAWSFLSDKEKRSVYDRKINIKALKQKVSTQNGASRAARPPQNGASRMAPPPPGQNGFHIFTKSTTAKAKGKSTTNTAKDNDNNNNNNAPAKSTTTKAKGTSASTTNSPAKTFWTVCKKCVMQYEFVRMYVNRKLLCPGCNEPFLAIETAPPSANGSNTGPNQSTHVEPGLGGFAKQTTFQWVPFPKKASPAQASQAAAMVQRAYETVKREREEAQAAIKLDEASKRKKLAKKTEKTAKTVNISSSGNMTSAKRKPGFDGFGGKDENPPQVEVTKDDSNISIKNRLMKKATMEIRNKLNEWSKKQKLENKNTKNNNQNSVPDPDFHNFDQDRTKKSFEEGQVWASYDDNDGMPRYYAMIKKVISLNPFKIKVNWLNPKPGSDPKPGPDSGPVSGFSKTFGDFKPGKRETLSVPNYFSHKINFTKQTNGTVRVFPRKGDVWALYSTDQKPDLVKQKFEIVEVDKHDEETGITVTPLVKVSGFKTVFHRCINNGATRVVLENEMFQFSHQIPSYLLTGQESKSAPKGCRELDPASVPLEFLENVNQLGKG